MGTAAAWRAGWHGELVVRRAVAWEAVQQAALAWIQRLGLGGNVGAGEVRDKGHGAMDWVIRVPRRDRKGNREVVLNPLDFY